MCVMGDHYNTHQKHGEQPFSVNRPDRMKLRVAERRAAVGLLAASDPSTRRAAIGCSKATAWPHHLICIICLLLIFHVDTFSSHIFLHTSIFSWKNLDIAMTRGTIGLSKRTNHEAMRIISWKEPAWNTRSSYNPKKRFCVALLAFSADLRCTRTQIKNQSRHQLLRWLTGSCCKLGLLGDCILCPPIHSCVIKSLPSSGCRCPELHLLDLRDCHLRPWPHPPEQPYYFYLLQTTAPWVLHGVIRSVPDFPGFPWRFNVCGGSRSSRSALSTDFWVQLKGFGFAGKVRYWLKGSTRLVYLLDSLSPYRKSNLVRKNSVFLQISVQLRQEVGVLVHLTGRKQTKV